MILKKILVGGCCIAVALAGVAFALPDTFHADAEVARIRAHFDSVVTELRAVRLEGLSRAQVAAREESIRWLEEYRAAGVFPHNHVRPDGVPIFVDPHGTPCAVGYLLLRSGEHTLVEDVVRHANLARVPELAGDERLGAWLERRGFTLAEAARIQPAYDGRWGALDPPPQPSYATETVGLSIVTAAAAALSELTRSRPDRSRLTGWINVARAAGHAALLTTAARKEGVPGWQLGVNLVGMVVSAGAAARNVWQSHDEVDDTRVAVAPYVGSGDDGRVNVGLSLRH